MRSAKHERIQQYNCIDTTHNARDSVEASISLQVDRQLSNTINALLGLQYLYRVYTCAQILSLLVHEHKFPQIIVNYKIIVANQ